MHAVRAIKPGFLIVLVFAFVGAGCSISIRLPDGARQGGNPADPGIPQGSTTSPRSTASAATSVTPSPRSSTAVSPHDDVVRKFSTLIESGNPKRIAKAGNLVAADSYAEQYLKYVAARVAAETDQGVYYNVGQTRSTSEGHYRTCWTAHSSNGDRQRFCETISDVVVDGRGRVTDLKNNGWHGRILLGSRAAVNEDAALGTTVHFVAARVTSGGTLAVICTIDSTDGPISIGDRSSYTDEDSIQHRLSGGLFPRVLYPQSSARVVFYVDGADLGGILDIELFDPDDRTIHTTLSFKLS